jgi:hypothetical protein
MELWFSCQQVQGFLSKSFSIISLAVYIENSDTSVYTLHVTLQPVWIYFYRRIPRFSRGTSHSWSIFQVIWHQHKSCTRMYPGRWQWNITSPWFWSCFTCGGVMWHTYSRGCKKPLPDGWNFAWWWSQMQDVAFTCTWWLFCTADKFRKHTGTGCENICCIHQTSVCLSGAQD